MLKRVLRNNILSTIGGVRDTDMSITTEANRTDELTTDGVETEFDFDLLIHADSEIEVYYEVSGGSYTQLVLDTDYTVVFTEDGGTVTTIGGSSPFAAGKLLIIRHLPITQQTRWIYNDNHTGPQHEDDFDRAVMRDLQIQEQLDRAVGFAITSDTKDIEFPEPLSDNIIGWNTAADALENKDLVADVVALPAADGNFIVGDGTNFVVESGATARASLGLTIGTDVLAQQTIGIADNNLLEVDGSPNDDEYAKFTADGLEGRTVTENRDDLGLGTGDSPAWTGATLSGLTAGRVLFAGTGGVIDDDGACLWDDVNKRLGINRSPDSKLSLGYADPQDDDLLFNIYSDDYGDNLLEIRKHLSFGGYWKFVSPQNWMGFEAVSVVFTSNGSTNFQLESTLAPGTQTLQFSAYRQELLIQTRDGNYDLRFATDEVEWIRLKHTTGFVGFGGETAPETLAEWTSTAPYLTLHNSTHEDSDGGGESRHIFKREDGVGTETACFQFEASHDGVVANDQLGKGIWSVNTGAGLAQALKISSDLAATFAGAINSGTLDLSAAGPTDDLDVTGVNTIFINTSGNNVTLGGTVGGVNGQVLNIVVHDATNNFTIEHNEGTGNQDFILHAGADEVMTGEYGGWVFVNDGGGHWHDCSHAKHV